MNDTARLERLFNLCALLVSTRRPLTLDEIVELVPGYQGGHETVRRAFERDKDALRGIGVPITVERPDGHGDEAGYRVLPEEYYLPELELTADERAALHMAATAVEIGDDSWRAGMWKLGGLAGEAAPPLAALRAEPALAPLLEACGAAATVRFVHRGEARSVDPTGLVMERGHWYLAAFDRDRQAPRTFRLDRIQDLEVGPPRSAPRDEVASLPSSVGRRPWELDAGPVEVAEVLVDAGHAAWVVGQLGEEAVVERRDAGVLVRMEVASRAAFRSFLLGLLDGAEVVGPPVLRQHVVDWLERMGSAEVAG